MAATAAKMPVDGEDPSGGGARGDKGDDQGVLLRQLRVWGATIED